MFTFFLKNFLNIPSCQTVKSDITSPRGSLGIMGELLMVLIKPLITIVL